MLSPFGNTFQLTNSSESHGKGVGGVVDGSPSGIAIDEEFVQQELNRRRPRQSIPITPHKEMDKVEFLPDIFEGKPTECPIGFIVWNKNQHPSDYNNPKEVYYPSHAGYIYKVKYDIRDHRGGERSSAHEIISRIVAGALAKSALRQLGISITTYTSQVGAIKLEGTCPDYGPDLIETNGICCPDPEEAKEVADLIYKVRGEGDTIGDTLACVIEGCPIGSRQLVFSKLHATLDNAMPSTNATKASEHGEGLKGLKTRGFEQNDTFFSNNGRTEAHTSHSGGIQGGVNNGQDIYLHVVFKPIATLLMEQEAVNIDGVDTALKARGRHDACALPRAIPIVEAMAAMTILGYYLLDRTTQL